MKFRDSKKVFHPFSIARSLAFLSLLFLKTLNFPKMSLKFFIPKVPICHIFVPHIIWPLNTQLWVRFSHYLEWLEMSTLAFVGRVSGLFNDTLIQAIDSQHFVTLVDRWSVITGSEDRWGCPNAQGNIMVLVGFH